MTHHSFVGYRSVSNAQNQLRGQKKNDSRVFDFGVLNINDMIYAICSAIQLRRNEKNELNLMFDVFIYFTITIIRDTVSCASSEQHAQ